MRSIYRATLVSVFVLLLISCRPANLKDYDKPYIDFDSLINQQITKIEPLTNSIQKISSLGSARDTATFKIDRTLLSNEWDVFRQLDVINKPIFQENYIVEERADEKSNLTIRSYTFTGNATLKSPVPFIRFYYQSNFNNLKRIESAYEEQDALYYTNRKLNLFFNQTSGANLIYHYTIEGSQKMIFSDALNLSIKGTLVF
jgi:hypothetical protein